MKRPAGLSLVAGVAIVLGLAQVVAALGYFKIDGLGVLEAAWLRGDVSTLAMGLVYSIGVGLALFGALGVVFGVAALRQREWAWPLGMAVYLLGIALAIAMLFTTQMGVAAAVTGVVSAIIAWYLSTYDVREAFGQSSEATGGHRPHAV